MTPLAFSPDTGYIYAQGRAHVGRARRFADPFVWNTARFHLTLPDAVGVLAAVDTATGRVVWKNEMPSAFLGTSGPLVTAGGLLFRGSPGGQVEAYDVRTGARRWAFRTSEEGSRLRPGPASAYEFDGTQYIAVAMGPQLWAFALDGEVPARGEPSPDPPVDDRPSGPAPRETDEIETATLLENPRGSVGGRRYAFDEYNFNPVRARVTAGTRVRFTNNGEIPHTLAARDGSWSLGTLNPGLWDFVTFDDAGDVPLSLRGPSLDGGGDHGRPVTPTVDGGRFVRQTTHAWRMKSVHSRKLTGMLLATLLPALAGPGAAGQDVRLLDAARAADSAGVIALLEQGVSANIRQADGATALHWAAHWDDAAMAAALVRAAADVDAANDFGATPLWLACLNGSEAMVATLLAAGADANAALPSGETVLMTASRTGSTEVVRLLAAHGADLNAREHTRGQTALMWAVAQRHPAVVEALIALGADVQARSAPAAAAHPHADRRVQPHRGDRHRAGQQHAPPVRGPAGRPGGRETSRGRRRRRERHGRDGHERPGGGGAQRPHRARPVPARAGRRPAHRRGRLLRPCTPPPCAATRRWRRRCWPAAPTRTRRWSAAARAGATAPTTCCSTTWSAPPPSGWPRTSPSPASCGPLAEGGADPGFVMEDGTTPLMAALAARRRREPGLAPNPAEDERLVLEAARVAIAAGVDVDAADAAGNTALHTAARRRLDTVVQLLADSGADLHVLNGNGQTPQDVAGGRGGDDNTTVELLRRLAADASDG